MFHMFFFDQISIRILCKMCKGTLMKAKGLIGVPDFSSSREIFIRVSYKII